MALTNNHLVKVVKMKKIHSQLMNQSKKMLVLFPFAVVLLLGFGSEQGSSSAVST